tara:strand:- start:436 stop:708 length:273 start_codon:yes stop_codon:yes gene_type:complete
LGFQRQLHAQRGFVTHHAVAVAVVVVVDLYYIITEEEEEEVHDREEEEEEEEEENDKREKGEVDKGGFYPPRRFFPEGCTLRATAYSRRR